MKKYNIRLATPADNGAILRILRENPMQGSISLSFEREPDYFIGTAAEGWLNQTILILDGERLIGMGNRALRDLYLDGEITTLGYLSQFRADAAYRGLPRAIRQSFDYCKELHADGRAPFYLTSIIEDNRPARRLLTSGVAGIPRYTEYTRMHTLAIYSRRKRRSLKLPDGLRIERGSEAHLESLIALLQACGRRHQFAPYWTAETLFNPGYTPGLSIRDFLLVLAGDQVRACLALWDQSAFKQTVVRGYSKQIGRWRRLLNIGACVLAMPVLPPVNSAIPYCYASHLAYADPDPVVFQALLRAIYNEAVKKNYSYFMLGLPEKHPFLSEVMKVYSHIDYKSLIYLVSWQDEYPEPPTVDERLPHIEIASL